MTNPKRIATAVEKKACNCLLLKVNQIGSVTESINAHLLAKQNGWGTMVSHRYDNIFNIYHVTAIHTDTELMNEVKNLEIKNICIKKLQKN